jgi:hypothetical protein
MINKLIQGIFWIIGAFVVGFVFCGCDECDGTEIQCNGNTVEICEDEIWEPHIDCSTWNDKEGFADAGPYKCCEFAYTAYCVPKRACEEVIYHPKGETGD